MAETMTTPTVTTTIASTESQKEWADNFMAGFDPHAPPLTDEQATIAYKNLIVGYPEVVRSLHTPNPLNEYVALSFLTSPIASYVKVCAVGSIDACNTRAREIIRNVDSRVPVAVGKLGSWCLVTNKPSLVSKETIRLVDNQEIVTEDHAEVLINKQTKEAQAAEALARKEINARVATLTQEEWDNTTAYIRKKVMLFENKKQIDFVKKKLDILQKRQSLLATILYLQRNQYESEWYSKYLETMKEVGMKETDITPDNIAELENDIDKSLLDTPLEDLVESLQEVSLAYSQLTYVSMYESK